MEQAKAGMCYKEFLNWIKFRNKYGPLHLAMRVDQVVSKTGSIFASLICRKKNAIPAESFSPWVKIPEDQEEATLDDAFSMLQSVSTVNEKK